MGSTKRKRPAGYYEVSGLDLAEEMRRLCALRVLGGPDGPLAREVPRLDIRRPSKRPRRNLGFAVPGERRISVTAYPGIRAGDALEVLLHEVVHIAIGRQGHSWHGRTFRSTLQRAMREAYGIAISPSAASVHGAYADELERRRLAASRLHPGQLAFEDAA
jgi:hypothetical protein